MGVWDGTRLSLAAFTILANTCPFTSGYTLLYPYNVRLWFGLIIGYFTCTYTTNNTTYKIPTTSIEKNYDECEGKINVFIGFGAVELQLALAGPSAAASPSPASSTPPPS